MIGGRRPLHGRKPADRRVRVARPHSPYFRYTGPGQMVAKEAASRPATPAGRAIARARAIVFGRVLANEEELGERLAKKKALAIFSSDAISSSAYATEEILKVLIIAAGAGALAYSVGVSVAIAVLLAVVSVSYRQVCRAYPSGGGAYVVARENLSQLFGLIAAAALLIDYVMTVAVSTASAIEQIQSVIPQIYDVRIEVAFVSICADHDRQPPRPARVREHLRDPDLPVRVPGPADDRRRSLPYRHRNRGADRADRRVQPAGHRDPQRVPPAPGVRRRLGRADRGGGHRQRGAGVQAARGQERRQHAHGDGDPARRSCSSGSRSWPGRTTCSRRNPADRRSWRSWRPRCSARAHCSCRPSPLRQR